MNVFGGVAVSMTFTHSVGLQRGEVFGGLANVLVRRDLRDGTHACVVLARARLVVRHLPDQVLGGQAGEVGGFRMALAGHQMARAARKSRCPGRLSPTAARGGVHRETSPADSRSRRSWRHSYSFALPGALTMPSGRTALGWILSGMLNAQSGSPSGTVSACLRVELPHHEERSEGAHEDDDADGRVCSEDSADHGGSPLPILDEDRL